MLFKKKPLIVEAIQYQAGKPFEIELFVGQELPRGEHDGGSFLPLVIETESGQKELHANWWLVRDVALNMIVKSPEQFEKEYEPSVKKRAKA